MKEERGNIWKTNCEAIVITTNGDVKKTGKLTMGKGIALDAKQKYLNLDKIWGSLVSKYGNNVYNYTMSNGISLFSLPTKHHWREKSDLNLIVKSIEQLVIKTKNYNCVALTRPGCGNGGLDWKVVKKEIEPLLSDKFIVYEH